VTLRERLPSFIPKEGLDPTYGAARPGWERYVSPRLEYLIFRENGAIRALQVIALQKEAIDAPFISSALRELCGDATCMIRTRSSRDGYLIEQGQTSTKAEVIFYKKKGTGETRGVVISLP
jgi:flagellar FliL protein